MSTPLNPDAVSQVFARELATAWASVLGGTAALQSGRESGAEGWVVTLPVSGVAAGRLVAWIDRAAASACALHATATVAAPAGADAAGADATAAEPPAEASDDAVSALLHDLAARAAAAVEGTPDAAGLIAGDPTVAAGAAPAGARAWTASIEGGPSCAIAALAELTSGATGATDGETLDSRLEAVLDVDLPLVVRFGRALLPLRAVADLGPGSVVDMGRSPDEPVDLLVGERLIARGEVVIVGGNYGVRITELTSGRRSTDVETRS